MLFDSIINSNIFRNFTVAYSSEFISDQNVNKELKKK